MTVSCINDEHVNISMNQGLHTIHLMHTDRCADTKTAPGISTRLRVATDVVDVPHSDEASKAIAITKQDQFLNAAPAHERFGFCERDTCRSNYKPRTRRHHISHAILWRFNEVDVATGQDASHLTVPVAINRHWEAGHLLRGHQIDGPLHGVIWVQRNWIGNDAVLAPLHF